MRAQEPTFTFGSRVAILHDHTRVVCRCKSPMATDLLAAGFVGGAAAAAALENGTVPPTTLAIANMPADAAAALASNPHKETLIECIKRLKDQQAALKTDKKNLQKELKNACKRKNRLKKRARQLTDNDLIEVLRMRKDVTPVPAEAEPAANATVLDGGLEDAHMSD